LFKDDFLDCIVMDFANSSDSRWGNEAMNRWSWNRS